MLALNTLQYKRLCILTLRKCNAKFIEKIFYNLQIRKKSEMVQTVQIDFSINGNTTRSQI